MAAGTVVCGSMVVMQLLLRIDIKGRRKTNVRNSWDGRPLLLLKVQVGRFGSPGGRDPTLGGFSGQGPELLGSACNGWMASVSGRLGGGSEAEPDCAQLTLTAAAPRPPRVAVGGPASVGRELLS